MLWVGIGALAVGIILGISGFHAGVHDSPVSHALRAQRALNEDRIGDCYGSVGQIYASGGRHTGLVQMIGGVILGILGAILLLIVIKGT